MFYHVLPRISIPFIGAAVSTGISKRMGTCDFLQQFSFSHILSMRLLLFFERIHITHERNYLTIVFEPSSSSQSSHFIVNLRFPRFVLSSSGGCSCSSNGRSNRVRMDGGRWAIEAGGWRMEGWRMEDGGWRLPSEGRDSPWGRWDPPDSPQDGGGSKDGSLPLIPGVEPSS